jgi:hypothetical protein
MILKLFSPNEKERESGRRMIIMVFILNLRKIVHQYYSTLPIT